MVGFSPYPTSTLSCVLLRRCIPDTVAHSLSKAVLQQTNISKFNFVDEHNDVVEFGGGAAAAT